MIERRRRHIIHTLPTVDAERHIINDGLWCWCLPSVRDFDEDELIPLYVKHVSWGRRMSMTRKFNP